MSTPKRADVAILAATLRCTAHDRKATVTYLDEAQIILDDLATHDRRLDIDTYDARMALKEAIALVEALRTAVAILPPALGDGIARELDAKIQAWRRTTG